jgi:hypothetical protein
MHDPVWVPCRRTDLARGCPSTARSAAFNASMAQPGRPQRKQRSRFGDQSDDRDRDDVAVHLPGDALAVDVDVPGDIDVVQVAELPLLLTIRQAANVLNVCPAKAYEMAHRYEATGCDGLPVIRLDKLYRVPRWALAVLILTGRVVTVAELEAHGQQVGEQVSDRRTASPTPAVVEPDAGHRSRSSGRRAAGGGLRSPGRRRAGSVEQLRLLQGD